MTKIIDNPPEASSRPSPRETAPSQMRKDEPTVARAVGMLGLMMVSLGVVAVMVAATGRTSRLVGPDLGAAFLVLGLAAMLFHAARDNDLQFRRSYGAIGYLWIVVAIVLAFLPVQGQAGSLFLPYGVPALILGLLFLLPFIRNEDDDKWKRTAVTVLGLVGVVLAGTGLIGSLVSEKFALPYGVVLAVLGLPYLWAFIACLGAESDSGYKTALRFGTVGAVVLLIALGRSTIPPLLYSWQWLATRPDPYFIPTGMLLAVLGAAYLLLAIGLISDNRLVVMTRRELAAFFYSPIAYIVLFCFGGLGWILFVVFIASLSGGPRGGTALPEPIVAYYILRWEPIMILLIIGVPILTMKLLSEERRTGSYEVLMTVPVSETMVVLSKFLGVFVFYTLLWLPWALNLLALRVESGQEFEYRPLLTFAISMACMGAGFLSMGLFFSSLTSNQIGAAILTALGMMFFTILWYVKSMMEQSGASEASAWVVVLNHISYLDLWIKSLHEGVLAPKNLLFHLSAAVFWLFLTVKVLESRKWR